MKHLQAAKETRLIHKFQKVLWRVYLVNIAWKGESLGYQQNLLLKHVSKVFLFSLLQFIFFSKEFTLYQMTNSRFLQIESICRWQSKCKWKVEIWFGKGRKHCGQRRKCWLPAQFPFPTLFSKGFLLKVVKSQDFVVNRVNPQSTFTNVLALQLEQCWLKITRLSVSSLRYIIC